MPDLTRRALLQSVPATALAAQTPSNAESAPDWSQWKLWYAEPAHNWNAALPIGNGRLGAMVFGGVQEEVLQLNEDTLWSGYPRDSSNPKALEALPAIRKLLFEGKYTEATEATKAIQGPFTESYLPLGYLRVKQEGIQNHSGYRLELDLDEAVVRSSYQVGRALYRRECFVSAPDQVLVLRITVEGGAWSGVITMDSPLQSGAEPVAPNAFALRGQAPSHVEPSYRGSHPNPVIYANTAPQGMRFEARARVLHEGGVLYQTGNGIALAGARSVTLLLSAGTGFRTPFEMPNKSPEEIGAACERTIELASRKPFEQLREAHLADHRGLFRRVHIDLGRSAAAAKPTGQRVTAYGTEADPHLAALYFQFGRYLLIAASRPGTQAANLQGIWNDMVRPPWSSNYTNNINVQMNYWPAEVTNLSECHEPMLRLVEELAESGKATAKSYYGLDGWVCHHNSDLWRATAPVGDFGTGSPVWAFWPMGAAWYCEHLWEHWLFTQDNDFMRNRAYPVMLEAARFLRGWLVEMPDGKLSTAPSTSPENVFLTAEGKRAEVAIGSAMDLFLTRSLFEHVLYVASLTGPPGGRRTREEHAFIEDLRNALARLAMPGIGSNGQLLEWNEEFKEAEPGHRHISPMVGLHPANVVTERKTPELYAASRKLLEQRLAAGSGHTGWSRAWILNFWARLREGAKVQENLDALFAKSTLTNLYDSHPPFQIDGNFGATAAIAEALLQSQNDVYDLLPALPPAWPNGSVDGLKARWNVTIGLDWRGGRLRTARMRSAAGRNAVIRVPDNCVLSSIEAAGARTPPPAREGGHYRLRLNSGAETVLRFEAA
ncbi:MAG: glycoside hydrolase family 95 protein [Bryobacterales bacterium]|nr:glycoside hydrolase family 95 protein [Bryobacterales bacterium]